MKVLITEKQLKKLIAKLNDEDLEEELDEQDATDAAAGESKPKSGASDDQQTGGDGYPEVGQWESGASRGPGNQIGNTKWSDVVGSKISRERNPLT